MAARNSPVACAVRTWADSTGRWHARVPVRGTVRAQRERARRAIVREVRQRQGEQRVTVRLPGTPLAVDGAREWIEG